MRLRGRVVMVVALALLVPAASADAKVGALKQLRGKAGCFTQQNSPKDVKRACKVGRFGGVQMWDAVVSPDGRNLYVASRGGAVSVLRIGKHGGLAQLRGKAGCVSRSGRFHCARVRQLSGSETLAVSPDGRNVYVGSTVAGAGVGAVVVFKRNRRTGALHHSGCVGGNGAGGCVPARALLAGVEDIEVSRDGRSVYVGSNNANPGAPSRGALTVFSRAAGGALRQLPGTGGCVNSDGTEGCVQGRGLAPECCGIATSPNAANVYVSSTKSVLKPGSFEIQSASYALASFARDASGALTQLAGPAGCANHDGADGCMPGAFASQEPFNSAADLLVSPNGKQVYLALSAEGAGDFQTNVCVGSDSFISMFPRNRGNGALAPPVQTIASCGVVPSMSPDGKSLYAAVGGFGEVLSLFTRNGRSGMLRHAGCIGHQARRCRSARHVTAPTVAAVTPNNRYVYVVSDDPGFGETIGVFRRSVARG